MEHALVMLPDGRTIRVSREQSMLYTERPVTPEELEYLRTRLEELRFTADPDVPDRRAD